MQAILLAGGFGTRLKPAIGDALPKPMATIGDAPFLAHYIQYLAAQGITEIMLAVHFQADVIADYFGQKFAGIPIRYSVETSPLGTGGAMRQALTLLKPNAAVFVSNADSMMDINIAAMRGTHKDAATSLTVALTQKQDCSEGGQARINAEGTLIDFQYPGLAEAGYVSMGAYIVEPQLFNGFDLGEQFSFENDFKQPNLQKLKPRAFIHDGLFLDIGTPERYLQACEILADKSL